MSDNIVEIFPTFPPQFPYEWCSAWGEDRRGIWVEFTVGYGEKKEKKAKQRMRWLNPGRFKMGSPKMEPERGTFGKETLHKVTLSQGYWLAESACTQALWEVVMGENPSNFKGMNRPAESLSWEECQVFLKRINDIIPGIALRLPTEAQWEYACRAGTITPFSFGDQITSDQVNFNGNYPYAGRKVSIVKRRLR